MKRFCILLMISFSYLSLSCQNTGIDTSSMYLENRIIVWEAKFNHNLQTYDEVIKTLKNRELFSSFQVNNNQIQAEINKINLISSEQENINKLENPNCFTGNIVIEFNKNNYTIYLKNIVLFQNSNDNKGTPFEDVVLNKKKTKFLKNKSIMCLIDLTLINLTKLDSHFHKD